MRLAWPLITALTLALAWQTCHRDRESARANHLATEILIERARADGWEATAADTATRLLASLAASDSQAARLSRELEALRARPIARTVVVASSGGEAEAVRDPERSTPDSTVYRVDDGPLSGVITTWADSVMARLDWTVSLSAELVHVEGADGRGLVFARSEDPRVDLQVPVLEYQRQATAERPRVSWRWTLAAVAGGYILGVQSR